MTTPTQALAGPSLEAALQELFPGGGGVWQDAWVCGVTGDPRRAQGQFGLGGRWRDLDAGYRAGLVGQNAYVCVSQFHPDPVDGAFRRKQHLAAGQYFLGVDDVGAKGDAAVLRARLGEPTLRIETSPGSEQWFYVFTKAETDLGRLNALVGEVIAQAFAGKDPGMRSATRLLRLPVGYNQKPALVGRGPAGTVGPGFAVRVLSWRPGTRFDIEALARGLGFTLPGPGTVRVSGTRVAVPGMDWDGDETYEELSRAGLVMRPTSTGDGVQVLCPNAGAHSDANAEGAAYFRDGGYRCHHGHCAGWGRREVLDWADEQRRVRTGRGVKGRHFDAVEDGSDEGPAGAAAGELFGELVYVGREARWLSLRTREPLTHQAVNDMWSARLAAAGAVPRVNGRPMPASAWFLSAGNLARARRVDLAGYWPGQDVIFRDDGLDYVNEWFAPDVGRPAVPVTDGDVELWLRVVRRLCSSEGAAAAAMAEHLLDWFAMVAWAPDRKPGHHPLVISERQGVGKDLAALPLRHAVGERNIGHMTASAIESQFNGWLRARLVVCQELRQMTWGGYGIYNRLKEVTDNTVSWLRVNTKNRPEYRVRNLVCFYLTSNHDNAALIEKFDRRFFVLMPQLDDAAMPSAAELRREAVWMTRGGGMALCAQWLRQRWEAMPADRIAALEYHAPRTVGRGGLLEAVEAGDEAYVREAISTGRWPDLMTMEDMRSDMASAIRAGTAGFKVLPAAHKVGRIVRALGADHVHAGHLVTLTDVIGQPRRARLWAVREPQRFASLGEVALSQAYVSARRHPGAAGGGDVTDFPF